MLDLTAIYQSHNSEEPLPARDDARYVDLSAVRGEMNVARRLGQRIKNAVGGVSHHLVMGHTKCGKTTELNRAAYLLEADGYVTVPFDMAEEAGHVFEYTTVLLMMAGQIVGQLAQRKPKSIRVAGPSTQKLVEFLREREVTRAGELAGEATAKAEGKVGPGLLAGLLGHLGIGLELRGGFKRSREITVKIEADTRGFLDAIHALVRDAAAKVVKAGHRGLVVICDGCDKLAISATDEEGKSRDLQLELFTGHGADLRSVPCHVIYTVPISIQANLGDSWEQDPEFVPAIPVSPLPVIEERFHNEGRKLLKDLVNRRLAPHGTSVEQLFAPATLFDRLLDSSGGHISDLLLLVREAVLEAQIEGREQLTDAHVVRSIGARGREYTRLLESKYLPILQVIDEIKTPPSNSDDYRELIFKRLVLEYICGTDSRVCVHPLVAASDAFRRWRNKVS